MADSSSGRGWRSRAKARRQSRERAQATPSRSSRSSGSSSAEPVLSPAQVIQLRGVAAREGAEAAAAAAEQLKAELTGPRTTRADTTTTTTVAQTTTAAPAAQVTAAQKANALEVFTTTPYQRIQERQITYAAAIGREETPTIYPQGVTRKPKTRFEELEAKVARRVTQPIARAAAKRGVTAERVGEAVSRVTIRQAKASPFLTQKQLEERRREQEAAVTGALRGIKEQPLKTGAVFAAGAAIGPAVSGTQLAAAKVAPKAFIAAAPVVQKGLAFTGKALGATYVGTKAIEYKAQPTPEARGEFLGRTIATEVAPFVAGIKTTGTLAARVQERAMVEATVAAKAPRETQLAFAQTKALAKEVRRADLPVKDPRINQVLKPKAAKVTSQHFASKGKARVVYGSAAQESAVKPGDIDVAARNPYQAAVEYADALQKAGIKDVVVPAAALRRAAVTGVEEATVFVQGKAVTFHTFKQLASNPFYMGKFRKSPSGVYVQQPAEQLLRKFTGAVYYGRAKDVPSFEELSTKLAKQVQAPRPTGIKPIKVQPTPAPSYYPVPKAPTAYPYPKAPTAPSYAYPHRPTTPAYAAPTRPARGAYRRAPEPTPAYVPPRDITPPPAIYTPPKDSFVGGYTRPTDSFRGFYRRPDDSYTPPPSMFRTPPPPGIPRFQLPRRERFGTRFAFKPRKLAQPKRYAPTLRATLGRIKAPKGKAKKFRLTGLEERPILF